MQRFCIIAAVVTLASQFYAPDTQAQAPCGAGIMGIGPFGIGVVIDCPPPPPQRVIIIKRHRRPYRYSAPRVAAPTPRPAPVVAAPSQLDAAQPHFRQQWTVGVMFDSSSYEDGGLAGGGVYGRFMFTPHLAFEGAISTLSSCTACNPDYTRIDSRFSTSVLWYFGGVQQRGLSIYFKGGLVFNNITFSDNSNAEEQASQTSVELGGGIELRLSHWFSVNAETTFMGPMGGDDIGLGGLNESQGHGVPSSSLENAAVNFKIGIAAHF